MLLFSSQWTFFILSRVFGTKNLRESIKWPAECMNEMNRNSTFSSDVMFSIRYFYVYLPKKRDIEIFVEVVYYWSVFMQMRVKHYRLCNSMCSALQCRLRRYTAPLALSDVYVNLCLFHFYYELVWCIYSIINSVRIICSSTLCLVETAMM